MSPEFELSFPMNSLKRSRTSQESSGPLYGPAKKAAKTSLLGDDNVDSWDNPHDNFVLCGRGERTNRHPGNKAFRRVVESNREVYHKGPRRNKALIAQSIVEAIYRQDPPGRFVRFNKDNGLWEDIGTKEAIKKTSQALREDVKKAKHASSDDDVKKRKEDDEDTESSYSEDDKDIDGKPPARPSTGSRINYSGIRPHHHGFSSAYVSYHSSEQGESEAAVLGGDYDGMINDVESHEDAFEPLHFDEPLSDLSRTSSMGSSTMPTMPTSFLFQTSIGSSDLSTIVSRGSSEVDPSEPGFDHQRESWGITSIEAI